MKNIAQYSYKERYAFEKDSSNVVEIDFDYNSKYEFHLGTCKVVCGDQDSREELLALLSNTHPVFSGNIQEAYQAFAAHMKSKGWMVCSIRETPYKLHAVVSAEEGKVQLELNIPNDSKKGVVSGVKVIKAESRQILEKFEGDFC